MFIKVWCEYDFSGNFGGDNNEEVFAVIDGTPEDVIESVVLSKLSNFTGVVEEELEGLFDWEYIEIKDL